MLSQDENYFISNEDVIALMSTLAAEDTAKQVWTPADASGLAVYPNIVHFGITPSQMIKAVVDLNTDERNRNRFFILSDSSSESLSAGLFSSSQNVLHCWAVC